MDWESPYYLLLIPILVGLLFWFDAGTTHPMSSGRRRALLIIRSLLVLGILTALASPWWTVKISEQAVVFVMDHSQSLGKRGLEKVYEKTAALREGLPGDVPVEYVAGRDCTIAANGAIWPPGLDFFDTSRLS